MPAANLICCFADTGAQSWWNAFFQFASYIVGIGAAATAALTYRSNSKRERAKWAVQLYEKFYENETYKNMRQALELDADLAAVQKLVVNEDTEFTDYLNFFEMVVGLAEDGQLPKDKVLRLFRYYLRCLKYHEEVTRYVSDPTKDYETLNAFLAEVKMP
jgi:hypothetical protein